MAPPKARRVAALIIETFDMAAPPLSLSDVIAEMSVQNSWHNERSQAQEYGERIASSVHASLSIHLDERNRLGQLYRFDFNSSSEYMIQGSCFIAPSDGDDLAEAKRRRLQASNYGSLLRGLTPRQFEAVCRGVIVAMGAETATLTRSSNDQGIDFFGNLSLRGRLAQQYLLPSFDSTLSVWLVGQAKHYLQTQVATPDIRELVGSVELARAGVYADSGAALSGLEMRRCDPVFYLFFTTGSISRDGWLLLRRSGVIAMDGETLAGFLADSGIGVDSGGLLDQASFDAWLGENGA